MSRWHYRANTFLTRVHTVPSIIKFRTMNLSNGRPERIITEQLETRECLLTFRAVTSRDKGLICAFQLSVYSPLSVTRNPYQIDQLDRHAWVLMAKLLLPILRDPSFLFILHRGKEERLTLERLKLSRNCHTRTNELTDELEKEKFLSQFQRDRSAGGAVLSFAI